MVGFWGAFSLRSSVGVAKVQERQDPRRGKGVGVAKVQERDALTTERYAGKRPARHFKGLKPAKRQP